MKVRSWHIRPLWWKGLSHQAFPQRVKTISVGPQLEGAIHFTGVLKSACFIICLIAIIYHVGSRHKLELVQIAATAWYAYSYYWSTKHYEYYQILSNTKYVCIHDIVIHNNLGTNKSQMILPSPTKSYWPPQGEDLHQSPRLQPPRGCPKIK